MSVDVFAWVIFIKIAQSVILYFCSTTDCWIYIDSLNHWVHFQALHHLYIFVGFYVATGKIHENVLFQVLLSLNISGEDGGINFQVSTE